MISLMSRSDFQRRMIGPEEGGPQMRKLLILALLVVSVVLVPSTASAHHRDFDGVGIHDWDIHCIKFYDDPGGPVSYYTFEGGVTVSETRADVWAIRVVWRLYDSKTGELYQELGHRVETDAQDPAASFGSGLEAEPEPLVYGIATFQWKRHGMRDITHTRFVGRNDPDECE